MAKSQTSKRDEEHELTRRALIKWSLAAGAALGVSRAGVIEILEKTAGKGVAFAASEPITARNIHMIWNNGGLAWTTLLFPHPDVALANNPQFAWHKPGLATTVAGTKKPLVRGPDSPFSTLSPARQMTAFVCGANETHSNVIQSTGSLAGNNLQGVISALQSGAPSVVPVITVGNTGYAPAAGSPTATAVTNADGIVNLFNSAASQAGGILAASRDANLYKAHYDAFAQLNRAANRSTTKASYVTASGAAGFLGTNLSAKLAITPADLTRYNITGNTRGNVAAIGRTLIVAVKAFKMGLTNSISTLAMGDDPHGAFNGGVGARDVDTVPAQLKGIFDAFMADLVATTDDVTNRSLSDDFVMSWIGDTTKDSRAQGGWPDGTANNHNVMYVWGGSRLYTGWFGSLDRNGNVQGFDANGNATAYNGQATARLAAASLAFAIAKGDERLIAPFANGVKIGGVFGAPKDQ
ncbi:MAG TPA: hypothetical protein VN253_16070 [Kofleriaceae bacterium]|nr:hypothetical protein [Kofleriaceae bacterium]